MTNQNLIAISVSQTAEVRIGEWYLWVPCENCPYPIALIHDADSGKIHFTFGHNIAFRVACPKCGHTGWYPFHQTERWRACAVL